MMTQCAHPSALPPSPRTFTPHPHPCPTPLCSPQPNHFASCPRPIQAMPFFDLASKIQPQEVKWALMVASCFRRIGAYPQVRFLHGH